MENKTISNCFKNHNFSHRATVSNPFKRIMDEKQTKINRQTPLNILVNGLINTNLKNVRFKWSCPISSDIQKNTIYEE